MMETDQEIENIDTLISTFGLARISSWAARSRNMYIPIWLNRVVFAGAFIGLAITEALRIYGMAFVWMLLGGITFVQPFTPAQMTRVRQCLDEAISKLPK